jgi:hypothetical protein
MQKSLKILEKGENRIFYGSTKLTLLPTHSQKLEAIAKQKGGIGYKFFPIMI